MDDDDRRDNMLGAFVLAVSDRLRRETEEAIGHTGASASALIMVAQFPDRTIEFLRQAIGLSHPATVRVVDRLVERGLVRRRPARRGPAVALTPTAAGKRQARELLEIRQRVIADSLPELSAAESDALGAILERALGHVSRFARDQALPTLRHAALPTIRLPGHADADRARLASTRARADRRLMTHDHASCSCGARIRRLRELRLGGLVGARRAEHRGRHRDRYRRQDGAHEQGEVKAGVERRGSGRSIRRASPADPGRRASPAPRARARRRPAPSC